MGNLNPGGFFAWVLVGLLAGWIAGQLTRGHGFGCFGNVVIGFLGALIGGLLFSALGVHGAVNFVGSVAVATLGAVILLAIANIARR
jgi:uncharacterized membrane protein YeaQ/YmgE (transglycosylase-associated protein family)